VLREREYVAAARCMAASWSRILFRQIAINTFRAFTARLPIAGVASVGAPARRARRRPARRVPRPRSL